MSRGKRKSFKGHDPYTPKDYPTHNPRKGGDWPKDVGHKHLVELVQHWFLVHGHYELPKDIVDKAIRYTFAAVRYFVDRERDVVLKGMGRFHYKLIENRKGRNPLTGQMFTIPPHIEPAWRPSPDWVDDLTFAKFQRPRKRAGMQRARYRYYLRRLNDLGLLRPDIPTSMLQKLNLTREQVLTAIKEREARQ
jgi:nucleoid DNA-binding protein